LSRTARGDSQPVPGEGGDVNNILWIVLIVILVLALLGFFTRGRW
jgi:flagellar basal body-associated protein FliL